MVKARSEIKVKPNLEVIKGEEIPHLLVPGELGAVLELIVKDKDGNITEKRVMRSKSFVRQFLELIWVQMYQIHRYAPISVKDTSGVTQNIHFSCLTFACDGGLGVVTQGIIVGTGSTGPTIDDWSIEALIAHGVGAGQLQYSAIIFGAPASDAATSQFTITRDFANASGGAITVNEIALYVKGYVYATTYYYMTIRDVIAGGVSVPNGQTLTVNYRLQAAV